MNNTRKFLASLALTVLPGTASAFLGLGVQDDWQEVRAHQALPAMHFVIPAGDLARVCKTHPAATTYGCAMRDPKAGVCLIYTAANPAQWVMEHERKHCAGWDHGPTPQHLAAASTESHIH